MGLPLCLFVTRLSSCSSTEACDFIVGSLVCVDSTGATSPGPKLTFLSPLGCWPAPAADDCALATTGSGVLLSRCGGALTLPTCIGAPEFAETTMTSLLTTARLVTVGASQAAASAGRPATGVPSWPLNLLPHVLPTANVESCEPQRCPMSYRGGDACLQSPQPQTICPAASQLRRLQCRIFPRDPLSKWKHM